MKISLILLAFAGICHAAAADAKALLKAAHARRDVTLAAWWNPQPEVFWQDDRETILFRSRTARHEWKFQQVNPATGKIADAFDHAVLAAQLGKALGQNVSVTSLPLQSLQSTAAGELQFRSGGKTWLFTTGNSSLRPSDQAEPIENLLPTTKLDRISRQGGTATTLPIENATPASIHVFWINFKGARVDFGTIAAGGRREQETFSGHTWLFTDAKNNELGGIVVKKIPATVRITGPIANDDSAASTERSPDGKWSAYVSDGNIHLQPFNGGAAQVLTRLERGTGSYRSPFYWSPDSRFLVCHYTKDVDVRKISIVQSSPKDQAQPKVITLEYPKAGDPIRQPTPHLFDIQALRQIPIDPALFPNPWANSHLAWAPDSSGFSFLYNQRGHQLMRLITVNAADGTARTLLEETSPTFIDYSQKLCLYRLPATKEIIWASEHSGWNHLYLIDGTTGKIKNAITSGNWNVKELVKVDPEKRTALLRVIGIAEDQDPYNSHFVRVNLDGSGLVRLTTANGDHDLEFPTDRRFYLDAWSRPDAPPVTELRRTADGSLIAELCRGSLANLKAMGWHAPEPFAAKGRDGKTDIHGLIFRPSRFDPAKSYPVLEEIYNGPHDFFVPKSFRPWHSFQTLAELGFIVVKIDGMGTNWRSRAFHDVCWKNLMDGGLPDRIAWIKAAAADRPFMDLSRGGITGGSAGGQNALAALLRHGDFYKVAVADSGCHDNRMDKAWWNEAWMGWPVDDSYAKNSNVTHAAALTGKLLLMYGEIDTNVDPASSAQVAHALQQAGKDFDYLPVMNAGHCAAEGSNYGGFRRAEFLLRHLAR
ncbi:MAG: DPP IV N-terminal domain-containing protein [Verrucomicrobiota bacterium]